MTSGDTGFYRKKDGGMEYVEIKLLDDNNEEFDMENLRNIFKDTIDSNKDKLTKIVDFGASILGDHYRGTAFMFGWVVQKIINTHERKNDVKLRVVTEVSPLDSDEIKNKTVDMLEDLLEKIKSGEMDMTDMPFMTGNMDYE